MDLQWVPTGVLDAVKNPFVVRIYTGAYCTDCIQRQSRADAMRPTHATNSGL